jgi:hypothetical protein
MSKRLVIILWSLVAVLAILTLIVKSQRGDAGESVTALDTGAVMLGDLPLKDIAQVRIEDATDTTTIVKGETTWEIAERNHYPANFSQFSALLRTMTQMTVAQSMQAGPAFNERYGMNSDAERQENHGFEVTFLNAKNEPIESLLVGKPTNAESAPMTPGGGAQSGRYLRLASEPKAVYAVNNALANLTGEPATWLEPTFIQVRNIRSLTFQPAEETGMTGWTMSREEDAAEFTMEDLPSGEELDGNKVSPLKNALSSPQFDDVLNKEEAMAQRDDSKARKVIATTFDGPTYTLDYAPKKADGEEDPEAGKSFLVSIEISGDLNETREPKADETEDEAQAADTRFAKKLAADKERLAKEKTFQNRSYRVPDYVFSQFDKSRETFFKTKEAPTGNQPTRPSLPRRQFGPGDAPLPVNPPAPEQETESGEPDSFKELSDEDIKRITEDARQAEEQK